jgi:elongation factor G
MKTCTVEKIRNFAIVGHAAAGKTSLAELMLFKAGAIPRLGTIAEGNTVSDFHKEEQERKSSVFSAVLNCTWKDHLFFFTDNPGYADFCGETCSATEAADLSLIVIDAVEGIGPGTTRAWKMAEEDNVPRAFFINGLDKDQAHYQDIIDELQDAYGRMRVIPFTLPVGSQASLERVVQVLFSAPAEIPDAYKADVEHDKQMLIDAIAESDEALMERYLSGEQLTEAEISRGLHKTIVAGTIVPVFIGSVAKDIGVTELMNGIAHLFPSELDEMPFAIIDGTVERDPADAEGIAWVFKNVNDPYMGQMSYLRIISGTWHANTEVQNVCKGSSERLGHLHVVRGKNLEEIDFALPGALVAVTKLKNTHIGDTLCLKSGTTRRVGKLHYPAPTMIQAVHAVNKGDEEKISMILVRFCSEDPTLKIERHPETSEELLYGMGDQHFAVIKHRLKNEFKMEITYTVPKVPYRETITAMGSASYRHKKQTGGHGQFAEVHLRLEPNPAGYEFVNAVVGGAIPKNYIPAVEKGVIEALANGPLAHCKVINVKASVYDGKEHPVDSSEMAFKIATRMAFREAMGQSKPVLLEPIMKLKVFFPEQYMGDITGDLNTRRARILGMGREEGLQLVEAEIPLAEAYTYAIQLRSITQGRGFLEMEPLRYDVVPGNISQKVQKEAQAAYQGKDEE